MTCSTLEKQNVDLVSLNQALKDCVANQDIEKAIGLAIQRQKALIEIFEATENNPSKLENLENLEKLATETLECLSQEKILLRAQSSNQRNDFLLRKSAIQAYMAPIAA